LILEEHDRVDYNKLATKAVVLLGLELAKSPYAPLLTANNPHRHNLHRHIRASFKKAKDACTLFVTFDTKSIAVSDKLPSNAPYVFEVALNQGTVKVNHAAACYGG